MSSDSMKIGSFTLVWHASVDALLLQSNNSTWTHQLCRSVSVSEVPSLNPSVNAGLASRQGKACWSSGWNGWVLRQLAETFDGMDDGRAPYNRWFNAKFAPVTRYSVDSELDQQVIDLLGRNHHFSQGEG